MVKKAYNLHLKEDEKDIVRYLSSDYYIQNTKLNKIDDDYLINHIQVKLYELLSSFLNGCFSLKGYILYPLVKDISKSNKIKIRNLLKILEHLNNKYYDFSNSINEFKKLGNINSKKFAVLLSLIYKDFNKIKKQKTAIVLKKKCDVIDFSKYKKSDSQLIKPIIELKIFAEKNLKPYVSGFYLHGSFSTLDYVKGWSDVDTLLIIKKDTINNPKKILRLRNLMYKSRKFFHQVDPLQHHGYMIITEYDLNYYCQTFFPVEIFKYSKSFFKNDATIKIKTRKCEVESINTLFFFVNYFRNIRQKKCLNPYDLKFLLHVITLFPTLYLQAKEKHMYKKFSFGIAKKDFEKDLWEIMNIVTAIRKNWKVPNKMPLSGLISNINPVLGCQINSKYWSMFSNISKINKIDTGKLITEMCKLSEAAWENMKRHKKLS